MTTYTISESIRRAIAEAIIEESAPGYSRQYMGRHYAVDTDADGMFDAVMFTQETDPWSPWPDGAVAVSVEELYSDVDADFSETEEGFEEDAIIFAESELPEEYDDGEDEDANYDAWLQRMAEDMYSAVSGADNRKERDALTAEIYEWLKNGDLDGTEKAGDLIAEWEGYQAEAAEATDDYE